MKIKKKMARPVIVLIAGVVAILTFAVVANAVSTYTVPNASLISYNLNSGYALLVNVPTQNYPVFVMGSCTTVGVRSVAQVTLMSVPGYFLVWNGLESFNSAGSKNIAQGLSATNGYHIVYLDWSNRVQLRVYNTTAFQIYNGATAARAGNIKLIW